VNASVVNRDHEQLQVMDFNFREPYAYRTQSLEPGSRNAGQRPCARCLSSATVGQLRSRAEKKAGCDARLQLLVSPKVLEPRVGQFGIARRVLDVFVAEIRLQRSRIYSVVGQLVAGRVPQHVRMRLEL
jgi:hypothetical protein